MAGLRYPPRLTRRAIPTAPTPCAAAVIAPQGSMVLAWHTTIASRWYARQQYDRSATPDDLLTARQDALLNNNRDQAHHYRSLYGPL